MEQTAFLLISITLVILTLIIGLLTFLVFKLARKNDTSHPENLNSEIHPEIQQRFHQISSFKKKPHEQFCPHHSDTPCEVMCAICDRLFCKSCVKPFKTMYFCKNHLPLVMQNEWEEILTVKTSSDRPQDGVDLYEAKKEIFESKKIPTFIETHYKINVDQDYIETHLVVFGIKEQKEKTLLEFNQMINLSH